MWLARAGVAAGIKSSSGMDVYTSGSEKYPAASDFTRPFSQKKKEEGWLSVEHSTPTRANTSSK